MPMSAEQRLWQHVLLAILSDLQSSSDQTVRDQSFARRWVGQYPSRDFRMVCDLAGLDPDCVHLHFKRISNCERSSRHGVARSNQSVSTGEQHLNGRPASESKGRLSGRSVDNLALAGDTLSITSNLHRANS